MVVLSKKLIELRALDGSTKLVKPGDLVDVPEKFAADPMYGWCVKDGTFTVASKSGKKQDVSTDAEAETPAKSKK